MAHFYGTVQGNRGQASRLGVKGSGLNTVAASWDGAIDVRIWWDEEKSCNMFMVKLIPWGSNDEARVIAEGILDSSIKDPFIPALIA